MNRRNFNKAAALAVPGAAFSANVFSNEKKSTMASDPFNLNYAPHFGMFEAHAGKDIIDQLTFMHDQGFRAIEDNWMKSRPVEEQKKIADTLERLDMRMGVFVAHEIGWSKPNLTNGDPELRDKFLSDIRDSLEVAKRVNAKWMTVVPGYVDLSLEMAYQTANVVDTLRMASEILEPHGVVMVLESLNWWANHAGQFLTKIPQAYQICRAVNSPSCKILFDIYHQQITEGNIIPNIDKAWSEIGYFQVGDNPGRNEPGTGEINYLNVFRHIHSKGFSGIVGMEHGNSMKGEEGEVAVIEAYRKSDNFR